MDNISLPAPSFIGRSHEFRLLKEERQKAGASLVVIYGRRRVGKTRLVTEFCKNTPLWRFDGMEKTAKNRQITAILRQLAEYSRDEIYASVQCRDWIELFKIINKAVAASPQKYGMTLFLDELPYMAGRRPELIAALKWIWDNHWGDKKGFTLILCGSIASFMIEQVVKSSALYGRISLEICLKPLLLPEVHDYFGRKKSAREICDLYMLCGGIPEYLRQINPHESIAENTARLAFLKDGYFVDEFDRLFKDVLAEERIYKRIIQALAKYKSLKVPELTQIIGVSPGGGFVDYMDKLASAGFVSGITPLDRPLDSKLKRYRLDDEYLLFYFKFIYPHLAKIKTNTSRQFAMSFVTAKQRVIWAGFAFERMCVKHARSIMQALAIDQLVKNYGPYFNRHSNVKDGVQIDLMFVRHDPVVTICEMKYYSGLVGKEIIPEVEKKAALLNEPKKTVEKVLITTEGITRELADSQYFSRVLTVDGIFAGGTA